jgi:hypothetical protein
VTGFRPNHHPSLPAGGVPAHGLPVGSAIAAAARPALSIQVENTPPARPQAGLNAADVVTDGVGPGSRRT